MKELTAGLIQRCIIHRIRNSTRYVSYKDVKRSRLRSSPSIKRRPEAALLALDELERVWGVKYPAGVKSWRDHLDELSTMYKYKDDEQA